MVKYNHYLGEFDLVGIPPAKRGEANVRVKFEVDASGILSVSAIEEQSGSKGGVTISAEKGRLSEEDIARMVDDAEKFAAEDRAFRERVEAKNELESYIYTLKNNMADNDEKIKNLGKKKELLDLIDESLEWMEKNEEADAADYSEKQSELEIIAKPLISSMYEGGEGGDEDDFDDAEDEL